jgi:hypothetical protein
MLNFDDASTNEYCDSVGEGVHKTPEIDCFLTTSGATNTSSILKTTYGAKIMKRNERVKSFFCRKARWDIGMME